MTTRRISYYQANRCENAEHPRCRCRCGGALHGRGRGDPQDLPYDDPHHAEPKLVLEEVQTVQQLERAGQLVVVPLKYTV